MVHVKHASVADGTVMTSFRLENVTHQTIASSFLLWVTEMKTPKNRNLTWISCHSLNERPNSHKKNQVECDK